MRQVWRHILGRIDYAITSARLWALDRIAGPLPDTEADVVRERERERLRRAFPAVDIDGTGGRRSGGGQ